MMKPRILGLLVSAPSPFPSARSAENFGSSKMACVVLMFSLATAVASHAQGFTVLYSFDLADGYEVYAGLIQATNGNFYGTTYAGAGGGTVFQITPGGVLTTLYTFCALANCADGSGPRAGVVQGTDGNFYGTTSGGGNGGGTVYRITPGGVLTTLHSFCAQPNCADGSTPTAELIQGTNGNFYGTTQNGGENGLGTIFEITPGGALTVLHSFGGPDGSEPWAGLIQATDGNFYGTTPGGGNGGGTVYRITPGGVLTTLYSFCAQTNCPDGATPIASLTQASDGSFYGSTQYGGSSSCDSGCGTLFELTPAGVLSTLHVFCSQKPCLDGTNPWSPPVQGADGNLYGTTPGGGHQLIGTIYELSPTGALTTIHSFVGANGVWPEGELIQASNQYFYGTAFEGGTDNDGTVFSFGPTTGTLSTISFTFGDEAVDETSSVRTVAFTNKSLPLLNISGISISSNFAISTNTRGGATLAANKSCRVGVTFTPTALGPQTGTLTFTDNAVNGPQTVALSGTGIGQATLTPTKRTFAKQTVGTTSVALEITLENNLPTALLGVSYSTTGPFAVSTSTCGTTLNSKKTCTISVTFTPTQTGRATGTLSVSDSANDSPQTASLSGTGG